MKVLINGKFKFAGTFEECIDFVATYIKLYSGKVFKYQILED